MLPDKLCPRETAAECARLLPRPLVFTNGVFDVLHRGHVACLAAARELGGSLVVGLNSDVSARGLGKGPDRPINNEMDRACVLDALEAVTMIVLFDEPTPLALIEALHPDVYVKGGDYDMDRLAEARLVRNWGGRAIAMPFVPHLSTTALVERIRAAHSPFVPRAA
jgi:rfaE bifunctional protein nucleotidyltransferase chain/domain